MNGTQALFNFTGAFDFLLERLETTPKTPLTWSPGSSLHIYGASGPAYGDYSIGIDSVYAYNNSAHAAQNGTDRFLMYSTDQLVYGPHEITITNLGSGILLDMVVIGVELGAQGYAAMLTAKLCTLSVATIRRATLTNTTLDESDPSITYTGSWTTNNDTLFHGGSSIYTSTPNDSLSFQFAGDQREASKDFQAAA